MANKNFLAFDFGASSGRAIVGSFDGEKITLTQTHRFLNEPVMLGDTFYWDFLRHIHDIKKGILNTVNAGYKIESIGIDSWGVDFGLIDEKGRLLSNPIHYRDSRNDGMLELLDKMIGKKKLYEQTGIQFLSFNTVNQLLAYKRQDPETLKRAKNLLFIPDLMAYFLTGEKSTEYTIASTSQLFNPKTQDWSEPILQCLGIDKLLFPKMVDPTDTKGRLCDEICKELGIEPIKVVAVAQHDTGSAVVAVPAKADEDFIYISCGTWSLMGSELESPIINTQSFEANVTNEGGINRTTRFLKNIIGLWIMQESKRQWEREGKNLSFKDIDKYTAKAQPLKCFIDPSDNLFMAPGNMPKRIYEYCKNSGQPTPESIGEISRCITDSLAMEYCYTLEAMEKLLNKKYSVIHMIGGGVKDKLLCQCTANATGRTVIAGPVEATALGNIGVQLLASKQVETLAKLREIIANSFPCDIYEPKDTELWKNAYKDFLKLTKKIK